MSYSQKPNAVRGMGQPKSAPGINGVGPQARFRFEPEIDLAAAITAHLGRDLFAGVTDQAERKARARVALVIDKLEHVDGLGAMFESIYGEPVRLPHTAVETPVITTKPRKGKAA